MSEGNVRFFIDGDDAHDGGDHGRTPAPEAGKTSETARLRAALADRASAYNELREVRAGNAAARVKEIDARAAADRPA
jgi:hypothetical protein